MKRLQCLVSATAREKTNSVKSQQGRQVGLFRCHVKKNTKKSTLQSKYKYIKNSMATGIAQKSYKALFPLWFLKK